MNQLQQNAIGRLLDIAIRMRPEAVTPDNAHLATWARDIEAECTILNAAAGADDFKLAAIRADLLLIDPQCKLASLVLHNESEIMVALMRDRGELATEIRLALMAWRNASEGFVRAQRAAAAAEASTRHRGSQAVGA